MQPPAPSAPASDPLRASFALAVDRPRGWLGRLDRGDAARRARLSFLALGCAMPLVALSVGLGGEDAAGIGRMLLVDLVAWLGFAAFSEFVLRRARLAARWPRMITVWNWCNVVQITLLLPAALPGLVPGCPSWVRLWVALVFWGWAMWLDWRAVRLGLGDTPAMTWPAVWLMLADIGIGVICQSAADGLAFGAAT